MEQTVDSVAVAKNPDAFRREAEVLLSRVLTAARRLVVALPGRPKTAAALTRLLGVQPKTGWQLFRLSKLEQPLAAASFMPGVKPLRDAAERARELGVAAATTGELVEAYGGVEAFVKRTGGDWSNFISMLGDQSRDSAGTSDVDRRHRASAFKVFSHFCGMQADASVEVSVSNESTPGTIEEVSLRTVKGLRRFRADAPYVVDRYRKWETATPEKPAMLMPLDKEAFREHGVPLVSAFCSDPVPKLVTTWDEKDPTVQSVEWASGAVGISAGVDLAMGVVWRREVNPECDGRRHGAVHKTVVGYPVKRLEKTWLARLPSRQMLEPELEGFLNAEAMESATVRAHSPRLYGHEKIEKYAVGSWRKLPSGTDIPREQIAYICGMMGWNPSEFVIYTLRIDYPLMHSALRVDFPWI